MTKRNVSTRKAPAKRRTRATAKNLALKGTADKAKRALPAKSPSKRSARKNRASPAAADGATLFNPVTAMIDSQVQFAGAMMRFSPLGFFLGGANSSKARRDPPARARKR